MGGSGSGRSGRFDIKTVDDGFKCLAQGILYQSMCDDIRMKNNMRLLGEEKNCKYLYIYGHDWFRTQILYKNIIQTLDIDEKKLYNDIISMEGL